MKTKITDFELIFSKENVKHVSNELCRFLIKEMKPENVDYDFKVDAKTGIMKPNLNPDGSFKANSFIRIDASEKGLIRDIINAMCIEDEHLPENSVEIFTNFIDLLKTDLENYSLALREKLNEIITGDKEQIISSMKVLLVEITDIPSNPYTLKITRNSASSNPSSKEDMEKLISDFYSEENKSQDPSEFLKLYKIHNKNKFLDILEITKSRAFYEINIDLYIDYSSNKN